MPDAIAKDDIKTLAQEIEKSVQVQQTKQWERPGAEPPVQPAAPQPSARLDQPASDTQAAAPGGGNALVLQ